MSDSPTDSVTRWVHCLKQGDPEAAARVWERFFTQIVALARARLGAAPRRAGDEEDVAASVFESLYRGAAAGRFTEMQDRDDLWKLLATITRQKAVDHRRRESRRKRGDGNVRGDSVFAANEAGERVGFDELPGDDLDPAFLVQMDEELERLLNLLRDESLRSVVRLRMEGYSNREIAGRLGVVERAVERKLNIIRKKWQRELEP